MLSALKTISCTSKLPQQHCPSPDLTQCFCRDSEATLSREEPSQSPHKELSCQPCRGASSAIRSCCGIWELQALPEDLPDLRGQHEGMGALLAVSAAEMGILSHPFQRLESPRTGRQGCRLRSLTGEPDAQQKARAAGFRRVWC